ncbi:MAG: TonB-dependent receptor [Acidobacteriia bacterium]|nr:TonB-dependent receptor [Terriglobia bacterium]
MRTIGRLRLVAVLASICFLTLSAFGQFDTGTIAGTVTDSSGAVLTHAKVTITNVGTAIQQTLDTDSGGNFVASAVPFGTYVVSANASGFAETKSQQVVLNVGATVHVNLALAVSGGEQRVEVTGTTTTVNSESSATGTSLNATQIANLPVNGRDVSSFLEIAPGSVGSAGFFQGSVNGLENIFTGLNITVDGQNASRGDINGFLDTEGDEGARVTRASVDSIQEIDFSNNGYNAENGRSLGPQMNIITKSGTNDYHGTLFEFFRNDALDAKDYFQNPTQFPQQPLRLNQFGGNFSGPIIRNKLFFFVNYEGDRQHLTTLSPLNHTLSAFARAQFVPAMQPVLAQMAPLPSACAGNPAPQSCSVPGFEITDDAGNYVNTNMVYDPAALPNILREDTGSIRLDHNISDKDRVFFRYNINDSLTMVTKGLNQGQVSPEALRTQLGKIDETHTFSPTLLNQFSVSINRFYSDTNSNTPTPLVGFAGFFTDLGSLPGPNTFNQITPFTVFEVFDSVTKTVHSHTLKVGAQIRANRLNEWLRPQQSYQFGSVSDLLSDNPFVLQKIGFPGFVGIRNSNWDFYLQDDWKVTRKLTVNLGLRYDYNTVWREGHNRQQNFDFATQSFLPVGQSPYNAPKKDFAPRVGFSWDPYGKGKTVVHGYGGLFYMPMQFGFGLVGNVPLYSSYAVTVFDAIFANPPYSIAYPAPNPPLPPQNVSIFPQHPRDPYSTNWLFGIQQEVLRDTVLTLNYTGNKVQHLQAGVDFSAINLNPTNPNPNVGRPLPGFASENFDADTLSSTYNALQAQLRRNVGRFNLEANYTWSHEIDNLVNVFGGWSNPFNPNVDRGSGDWDVRHNFSASLVYNLPDLKGSGSALRGILGGWQTSSIVQTRSGLPENIQLVSGFFGNPMRPDYVLGQPLWLPNHSWPSSSYNLSAFSFEPNYDGIWGHVIGTVGRNALRAPRFFQWDLSIMKNFGITERLRVQFRADLFNILNHPNFTNPDGGICSNITYPNPFIDPNAPITCIPNTQNFGRSSQTIADVSGGAIGNGTARQAQLSLKVIF